ncbi:MAG: hypothetical protein JW836_05430 [Deltaproteobacteria bacterium]|nr:hypothetical protein [Deltaproteobacteria bacterium]
MTQYLIRPLDTQFHRTGLPFDAAQDVEASSQFPPSPRTVYGAIRAWVFSDKNIPFNGLPQSGDPVFTTLGNDKQYGTLAVKGPVMCRLSKVTLAAFLPMPADLVKLKNHRELRLLRPDLEAKPGWDLAVSLYPVGTGSTEVVEANKNRFLNPNYLKEYLAGSLGPENRYNNVTVEQGDVFRRELRVGIAREGATRTAKKGFLYRAPHHRLVHEQSDAEHVLWVEMDGHNGLLPEAGVIRLGGEGRPARISIMLPDPKTWYSEPSAVRNARDTVLKSGRFKLYLITPGVFGVEHKHCVALPDAVDPGSLSLDLEQAGGKRVTAQLVGACVAKPIYLGGWDIRSRREKPHQACVPAGSVYFFCFHDWASIDQEAAVAQVFRLFHGNTAIQKGDGNASKEGFGFTLVGGW